MTQASDLEDAVADLMASRSTGHHDNVMSKGFSVTADDIGTTLNFVANFPSSN